MGTAPPVHHSSLHVLVADDNEVNQMVASEMLRAAGHRPVIVSNECEAVQAVRNEPFDVVLMDCEMPEMDGFEAVRMIRAMELEKVANRALPVIALTAQAIQSDRERCLAAGMTDYVTKPVKREELLRTIAKCVSEGSAPVQPPECSKACIGADSDYDQNVLDLQELSERFQGDTRFIDELLQMFVTTAQINVADLNESLAQGRIQDTARLAHKLKGSAANVAAARLSTAVAELETAVRARRHQDYSDLADRVIRELDLCVERVDNLQSAMGA